MIGFIKILIGIIAFIHIAFLVLEMFLWDKDSVQENFQDFTDKQLVKVLANNQGLYNGFLAAGLIWGLLSPHYSVEIWTFFLCCIAIAGIYGSISLTLGGATPKFRPTAPLAQTLPATITPSVLWLGSK
jgi:putative membrane protein